MSSNPGIRQWCGRRVWVIGASSGIGAATASTLLERGAHVALSARREEPLRGIAAGHEDRARVVPFDATDPEAWASAAKAILEQWERIDLAIFMVADYRPLRAWQLEAPIAEQLIRSNLITVTHGLSVLVPRLLAQGSGGIALTASAAGYGGLPHALVYGPTKAGLINLAEALYLDLHPRGVAVTVINPGFVRTALTARNTFPMPGLLEPDEAAQRIVRGLEQGRFEIAFPRRLVWPLKLLRLLPRRLYLPLVRWMTGA